MFYFCSVFRLIHAVHSQREVILDFGICLQSPKTVPHAFKSKFGKTSPTGKQT